MNELAIKEMNYDGFEMLLQDEGNKLVFFTLWNNIARGIHETREVKGVLLENRKEILDLKHADEKFKESYTEKMIEIDNSIGKVEDFADCFYNHADASRDFDNHVHHLAYKNTGGAMELKDKLFHSTITKNCKKHVTKSLNVGCVGRIKVSDLEMSKKLATSYLSPYMVNNLISNAIKKWRGEISKGSIRNKTANEFLDKYIELENEKMMKGIEAKMNEI